MRSKKKCEKIVYTIAENYLESLNADAEIKCRNSFEAIFSSSDAVQQINLLKEVQKALLHQTQQQLESHLDMNILCLMFYQSPIKTPHKKTLNRILQDLSEMNKEIVKVSLKCNLEHFISVLLQDIYLEPIDCFADCLLGLMDNFPLGGSVLDEKYEIVWKNIASVLNHLVQDCKSNSVELYGTTQSVLKAFIHVLQNCDKLRSILRVTEDENFITCSQSIVEAINSLLINDAASLNCHLNAGIALCYYYSAFDHQKFINNLFNGSGKSFLELDTFSPSSQLCIFSGIMAVISVQDFIAEINGCVIAHRILHRILQISECVEDSELLLLCTRDLIQWTNVVSNAFTFERQEVMNDIKLEEMRMMFIGDGSVVKILFPYVLHFREHYVDTLRHLSKELFRNVLNLHILSITLEPQESSILKEITNFLLNDLPQHKQGKYGLLSCIVDIVGTYTILQWHPSLPETLYTALSETTLVSHVCDLLETLFKKSFQCKDHSDFISVWLKPLLKHLSSESKEQTAAMNEHMLPKLFKVMPSSVNFLLPELSIIWEKNIGNCFSALITCVKFRQREKLDESIMDSISFTSLKLALCHADDQVRLSALSLLCENRKTTEPIVPEVFELIKVSLPYNINCQAPAFRQQLVSYLKKLFTRMVESNYSIEKKKQDCDEKALSSFIGIQETYEEFFYWIKKMLFSCLKPGANFPRRVTVLNLLQILHTTFSPSYCVVDTLTEAESLFYALQDTYENNKIISLKILSTSNISNFFAKTDENYFHTILQTALILSSSTKPPDTVTSAYIFALMVQSKDFEPVMLDHVNHLAEQDLCFLTIQDEQLLDVTYSTSFIAMLLLGGELIKHFKLAQSSLLDAATHTPLYGVLACMRSILSQVHFSLLKDSNSIQQWSLLICQLIVLCLKVATTVEPVVCNSSPEGHLPMDTDSVVGNIVQLQAAVRRGIGRRFQSAVIEVEDPSPQYDGVVIDVVKTHAVTAQILLLCCWRAHKEVSLLFGDMVEKIPIKDAKDHSILNTLQVMDIGSYFIRQMTFVKHKGAFEQAYIGFSKLCHTLWRCNILELQELPKIWLTDLLLAIKGQKENIRLCSTRRSAGVPFIVQALLASQPGLPNSSFFKDTIFSLLTMASAETEKTHPDEKIHALNILRALFRDACLSEALIPFISEGLKVSISGFKSHSWAVRNSSTMLFSALMTRIFGVTHSHDEAGKKNKLTGKTFFSYYKGSYSFLHDELEHCASVLTQNPNSVSKVPALYPILLVLGRLYPASGEYDCQLGSFIPYLHVCSSSPVMKIRILAAKALVPLISNAHIIPMLQTLFDSIPLGSSPFFGQNKIHGKCLQILSLVKECSHLSDVQQNTIKNELKFQIENHFELGLSTNRCYTTRAAFLEVVLFSLTMNCSLSCNFLKRLVQDLLLEINVTAADTDKEHYLCVSIVLSLLQLLSLETSALSALLLEINSKYHSLTRLLEDFLTSPYGTVRCTVLRFLVYLFEDVDVPYKLDADSSINPIFFSGVISTSLCTLIPRHRSIYEGLLSDCELSLLVLKMITQEDSNSSCMGMVYHLLCLMPRTVEQNWDFILSSCDSSDSAKLEYILSQMRLCNRDDVSNTVLVYSTYVALNIYKILERNKVDCAMKPDKCNKCINVLEKWSKMMEDSAQPENCISKRKAVVHAFQALPHTLLFNESGISGNSVLHLWQTFLCLLIDDEPEIKQLAAEIVVSMRAADQPGTRLLPVVPSLALDWMIEIFTIQNICDLPDYIGFLLNWMLSNKMELSSETGDEQPFDKGELNVFAEDLLITKFVSKHLSRLLHSQTTKEKFLISADKISLWQSLRTLNRESFDINSVIAQCLIESRSIVQRYHPGVAISHLLDPHFEYDLLQLCQRLHVILCLVPWCQSSCESEIKELLTRTEKLRYRTFYLEDLESKLHKSLSEKKCV